MRDLGYVEGQSFILDTQYTDGKNEVLPELATALVRAQADVIVAGRHLRYSPPSRRQQVSRSL